MGKAQQGFTLLELMLVLVIIAVSSSLVMLSYGQADSAKKTALQIADQLNSMIEFCVDKAAFEGKPLGVLLSADGWQIVQPVQSKNERWRWIPLPGDRRLTLAGEWGSAIKINVQPFELKESETPQILVLPDGQITPFTLALNAQETRQPLVTLTSPGTLPLHLQPMSEDRP